VSFIDIMPPMNWLRGLFRKRSAVRQLDLQRYAPVPENGFLVGGAVRDALLGRAPTDLDWLVPDPEGAARQAADVLNGAVFALDELRGHWRVVTHDTTRDYILLAEPLDENLRARDFTLNALAVDASGEISDPTGGLDDLRDQALRMISAQNLYDDPLRPLRGVRLSVTLGFVLEPQTLQAIRLHAQAQAERREPLPARERVAEEVNKLLTHPRAGAGLQLMNTTGLLDVYLPELAHARGVGQGGMHHLDVLEHSLEALNQLVQGFPEADLTLRWATLLHDVGKPDTKTYDESGQYYNFYGHDKLGAEITKGVLRRYRLPSEYVQQASNLVRYHMLPLPKDEREARRFVHRRRELLPGLLQLMIADREAARGALSSEGSRRAYRMALSRILAILAESPPKAPLLDGHEIMQLLGLEPGPEVGEAARFVQEAEAVGDVHTKAEAIEALRAYAQSQGWLEP
jgi:poly(A) polymerase